jgi:hypothetical protein
MSGMTVTCGGIMEYEAEATALNKRIVEIPVPTEKWHQEVDESLEFDVQQVPLQAGHFGVNYRRC